MDEARHAYYQDVAVRSVQMTNKEIMEKHGETEEYPSLNGFMSYSDFTRLPNDLKVNYVNKLCDRYDISIRVISRHLFNKGDDGLRAYLSNNKLLGLGLVDMKKKRGDKPEAIACFRNDVKIWQEDLKKEEARRQKEEQKEQEKIKEQIKKAACPMMLTWAEYKKLEPEAQANFLNRLIKYYQVTPAIIAKELFDIRGTSLYNHMQKAGITKKIENLPYAVSRNKDLIAVSTRTFQRYISAWKDFKDAEAEEEAARKAKEEAIAAAVKKAEEAETARKAAPSNAKKAFEFEEIVTEIKPFDEVPEKKLINMPPDEDFVFDQNQAIVSQHDILEQKLNELEKKIDEQLNRPGTSKDVLEKLQKLQVSAVPSDSGWYRPAEEPEPETAEEPEPDPMEYHQMHFSTNYISSEINMDEIYAIAAFFKRSKRVKVSIDISEV